MPTIMEAIADHPDLKTLARALEIAEMTAWLNKPGPFTFFAPNDAAFARLNVEEVLKDKAKLKDILAYHLVAEKHLNRELNVENIDSLVTEQGKSLSIYLDENDIMIDNAHVVQADIECGNGVMHIIDNVFLPQHSGWYETTA